MRLKIGSELTVFVHEVEGAMKYTKATFAVWFDMKISIVIAKLSKYVNFV